MKRYKKLIFVDDNDSSRAPMAKIIMKNKFLLGSIEIESRGMVVLFPEPINQKVEAILVSNGYSVEGHAAKQLTQDDFGDDVLILTMEGGHKEKIWENYENAKNVYTLTEYIKIRGELSPLFGLPLKAYGQCYEMLEMLISGLVVQLNEEELLAD